MSIQCKLGGVQNDETNDGVTGDRWTRTTHERRQLDLGFTLVEMLLVVAILGILASTVVMVAFGMRTDAASTSCAADRHQLMTAVESYYAQAGTDAVPATGTGVDRYEQTLVGAGFLRAPSVLHDIDINGEPNEVAPC